ncbi:hypothetical protein GEMRC1_006239 [Eukaryota sp. GEM-RC1]
MLEDYASLMAADCWPDIESFSNPCNTAKDKFKQALRNAHLALIRLHDRAAHLRAQRLELAKCILTELEDAGETVVLD